MLQTAEPAWLSLLQKPYENIFGAKSIWDLRMADGTAVRIERGSQGLNNSLYRVRLGGNVYACKLFVVDERRRAHREWTALCSVHEAGLKLAPEPIAYAPDGPLPQPAVVYSWVNGTSLNPAALTLSDLTDLMGELARLHRTPPAPGLEALAAWHQPAGYAPYLAEIQVCVDEVREWANKPEAAAGGLPAWAAALPELMPAIEAAHRMAQETVSHATSAGTCPMPALVRLDGELDNLIRDEHGQFMFLDWEYSGWGDPAFDLVELRWHPRAQAVAQSLWTAALTAYPVPPGDEAFAERLSVYGRLVPVWWVARSALHLLEGLNKISGRKRAVAVPARMYRAVHVQLENYLAALGLIDPPEREGREED